MNDLIVYRESDLDEIHRLLSAEDARELKARAKAVAHFLRSKDKDRAAGEIRAMLPELKGMSAKNLYKLASKFDPRRPLVSLADGRMLRRLEAGGLAANREFMAFWHELCLNNKRKTAPAYRELFARLRAGEVIPGFGDWREVFAKEYGLYPAPDRACPYEAHLHVPCGWTARTLNRLKPGPFALVAARKGTMAATMEFLPDIHRTRVGLKSCRVVQIDDMWYEHKVAFGVNRHAQRVVEFSMIDVATGKFFAWLTKPVLEKEDGKRETLKSRWARYLVAHLVGTVGVPEEGVLVMGEHGTASADKEFEETLARISGGRIRFGAGGLLSTPLGKGLYEGTPKGNPRYKGLLEGQHGLIKNELAAVKGHMGGGREGKSEFVYGMEKQDEQLRAIAKALRNVRPGIESRLDFPFMDFFDFKAIVDQMYAAINARRTHDLEGWDECGFMSVEYFNAAACAWVPVASVAKEPRAIQQAVYNAIRLGQLKVRRTRMSPAEAWEARAGDRVWKLPPSVVAIEVMGLPLARTCRCDQKLELTYRDPDTLAEETVTGIIDGGGSLTRGENYLVWINPFDVGTAHVADMQGKYIGTARVTPRVSYADQEAIRHELGVRQAAIAAERKRLQPAVTRMQMAENARARRNAEAVFGEDPALKAAVGRAAAREIEKTDAADLDFGPVAAVADHGGPTDEELAGL